MGHRLPPRRPAWFGREPGTGDRAGLLQRLAGRRAEGRRRPEIAFKPDPNYRSPDGTSVGAPDIHAYRLAIDAFTREYSNPASTGALARVQIISPWGEPDVPAKIFMPKGGHELRDPNCYGSPSVNTCGPILAAHMWQAVRASCTRCDVVIAGDFSSLGGIRGPEAGPSSASRLRGSYLDVYRRNLSGERPPVWGLHGCVNPIWPHLLLCFGPTRASAI